MSVVCSIANSPVAKYDPARGLCRNVGLNTIGQVSLRSDTRNTLLPSWSEKFSPCHRLGGIAPWAMTSYRMIRGFSPMIREVLRTRRMPPWGAHPRQRGVFLNDRSLSSEEYAHYRGRASEFRLRYPSGTERVLLSVPDYDFNWQFDYIFREPIDLPAGTTVIHDMWWDNSANRGDNPNPDRTVTWGLQSSDEMMIGWIAYHFIDANARSTQSVRGYDHSALANARSSVEGRQRHGESK